MTDAYFEHHNNVYIYDSMQMDGRVEFSCKILSSAEEWNFYDFSIYSFEDKSSFEFFKRTSIGLWKSQWQI